MSGDAGAQVPGPRDEHSPPPAPKPGLFERLRNAVGLGAGNTRDDLHDALADTSAGGDFSPQERVMLKNVLALHDLRVSDVMLPRADIVAVNFNATLSEVLRVFRTAGHSRLPVHGETLDDPRGMVHIRDFLDHLASGVSGRNASTRSTCRRASRAPTCCAPCCSCRRRCPRSTCW